MGGGLGSTLMTGMAFGAGSEIAHQAVRGMMGGGSGHGGQAPAEGGQQVVQQAPAQDGQMVDYASQEQQQQHPCQEFNMNFVQCLKMNASNIDMCQSYMNMLQQCETDYNLKNQNFQ